MRCFTSDIYRIAAYNQKSTNGIFSMRLVAVQVAQRPQTEKIKLSNQVGNAEGKRETEWIAKSKYRMVTAAIKARSIGAKSTKQVSEWRGSVQCRDVAHQLTQ